MNDTVGSNQITFHTEKSTKELLSEFFGGRLIYDGIRPPRFPDYLNFVFFGYIKYSAKATQPATIDELKANITRIMKEITPSMLKSHSEYGAANTNVHRG